MQTDLLAIEIGEKRSRSIQCQMTVAKLPLSKELEKFAFDAAQVDETLVRSLASSDALDRRRNTVLIGGTDKTHLAVGWARSRIRDGRRGRFFNVVDLVNRLVAEAKADRQGPMADARSRLGFLVPDELSYLPFALNGGQLLFHLAGILGSGRASDCVSKMPIPRVC